MQIYVTNSVLWVPESVIIMLSITVFIVYGSGPVGMVPACGLFQIALPQWTLSHDNTFYTNVSVNIMY